MILESMVIRDLNLGRQRKVKQTVLQVRQRQISVQI